MSTITDQSLEVSAAQDSSRLADLLRWLGTFAVALSGMVFLVQGLEDLDASMRHWACLILMALVTTCGVGTRVLFGDARSARLLLGLGVALVPVQFAQLGGLIHILVTGAAPSAGLFDLAAVSPIMLAAVGAATLAAAPVVAFAGFSVLVRPAARHLTWAFLLPNMLLLLPWREGVAGFAIMAVLAALVAVLDRLLITSSPRFATGEGRAVRAMFLIPAAIAAVRLGFHLEAFTGYCAMAAFAAVALAYTARCHVGSSAIRELVYPVSALMGSLAWGIWALNEVLYDSGLFSGAFILLPMAAVFLAVGQLSSFGRVYRGFASLLALGAATSLITADQVWGPLTALGLGAVLSVYGCLGRVREPMLAGILTLVVSAMVLAAQAWSQVHVSSWVALACAGVLLVLCGSFVERFGRTVIARTREGWTAVSEWQ